MNGDTVFEIGSVTKVFTSLLLSDMVKRGEVALAEPVAKYLPTGTKVPQRNGRQITLEDLSTHTSGLPRIPSNMKMADPANPYADYTPAQMFEFLASYELPRAILDRTTSIRILEVGCSAIRWRSERVRIVDRFAGASGNEAR